MSPPGSGGKESTCTVQRGSQQPAPCDTEHAEGARGLGLGVRPVASANQLPRLRVQPTRVDRD